MVKKVFKYYGNHMVYGCDNLPIEFRRKVVDNNKSLMVNIPYEIAQQLGIKKGDTIVITFEDDHFKCRKG
ncbi:MAG: AbrB/MazE/SpoVT family DNA-binding domain-containing protein [Candidatus Heimdallarchaeota archaeon]